MALNGADISSTELAKAVIDVEKKLEGVEAAKQLAGIHAVEEYFDHNYTHVGIGSGSTIVYVLDAIVAKLRMHGKFSPRRGLDGEVRPMADTVFVPTGHQSQMEIEKRGLTTVLYDRLPDDRILDVAFDGADEVDDDMNCVKGGGACLFQEKLVAMRAKKFICVADYRKDVPQLLTTWPYIPIEVAPIAIRSVCLALRALGCPNPTARTQDETKAGLLKTDQNFNIVKATFPPLLCAKDEEQVGGTESGIRLGKTVQGLDARIWNVEKLAHAIKMIPGVLEVGLFCGTTGPEAAKLGFMGGQKPVAVYFGLADGSVKVKKAANEP